jgi:hypothetical protein
MGSIDESNQRTKISHYYRFKKQSDLCDVCLISVVSKWPLFNKLSEFWDFQMAPT